MNFNSLIIAPPQAQTTDLLRRQIGMYLSAGQHVVYIGGEPNWSRLRRVPFFAQNRISFIHTPSRICIAAEITKLYQHIESLQQQAGLGIAVYFDPAFSEFAPLIHQWLDTFGITVHLVLNSDSAVDGLGLGQRVADFRLRCVFLCNREPTAGMLLGLSATEMRPLSGVLGQFVAVRFDNMVRLIDVSKPITKSIHQQIQQLQAALPVIMPGLRLSHIPIGIYSIACVMRATDRVYVDADMLQPGRVFLCYDLQETFAHELARVWGTYSFTIDEYHFVALPKELALWPFNHLGEVLDPSRCLWWRNLLLEQEPDYINQIGG